MADRNCDRLGQEIGSSVSVLVLSLFFQIVFTAVLDRLRHLQTEAWLSSLPIEFINSCKNLDYAIQIFTRIPKANCHLDS